MFSTYLADPEISRLCSPESFVRRMLDVEIGLATAQGQLGIIPANAAAVIAKTLTTITIVPESLAEGTLKNGIPTIPLLSLLKTHLPESAKKYVHVGATSQDIMDTAQVLIIRDVIASLEPAIHRLLDNLSKLQTCYGNLPMMGRTRTQRAMPITFGQKVDSWMQPLIRHLERLTQLQPRLLLVQLGGAVGNNAALGDAAEAVTRALTDTLGLGYSTPWHTQRDGLAEFTNWLALLTGSLGKFGQDVLIMGQTEIGEVTENVDGGGKSSAMPHKNNPVLSEALVVLARQNAQFAALQLQSLVHSNERDATAWMLEWENLPRMMINAGTALRHAISITQTMGVSEENMKRNM